MVDETEDNQVEKKPENLRALWKVLKDFNEEEAMVLYVDSLEDIGWDPQEKILNECKGDFCKWSKGIPRSIMTPKKQ